MAFFRLLASVWGSSRRAPLSRARRHRTVLGFEALEDRCLLSTISGFVYNDANNNGLFDPGETGLAGSTLRLLNPSGAVIGTTTSAADGSYRSQPTAPSARLR
jgi:hypothetical protein